MKRGVTPVTVDRSPATSRTGNNNVRLNVVIAATNRANMAKTICKNGDNESVYHGLKNMVYAIYYVAYAFVVCLKTHNE